MANENKLPLPFRHRGDTPRSSILSQTGQSHRGVELTDEQKAAAHTTHRSTVVSSCPGSGKSETVVEYAALRPEAAGLILVFAKRNRVEMMSKLRARGVENFVAHTFHSIAYKQMIAIDSRYGNVVERLRPWDLAQRYGVTNRVAGMACRALGTFFNSAEPTLTLNMFVPVDAVDVFSFQRAGNDEVERALTVARQAWQEMKDGKLTVSQDGLFKMFVELPDSPERPKLPFGHIVVDEAQDMNAAMLKLMLSQTQAQRLYVGDKYQSIFGFRGAVDAMDQLAATSATFDLTRSFRFPQRIADVANTLLNDLVDAKVHMVGAGTDAAAPAGAPLAYLSRGNGRLFEEAVSRKGVGIHWLGGIDHVQVLLDVYHLNLGDRAPIKSQFYRAFAGIDLLEDYSRATGDTESGSLVKLVKEYRSDIPEIVEQIRSNAIDDQDSPSVERVFSTVHKAKGMQWHRVQLADDFRTCSDVEEDLREGREPDAQEVNLLNVAVTRARRELTLNADTDRWLAQERVAHGRAQAPRQ